MDQPSSPPDQGTIVIAEERLQEGWTNIPNTILRRADVSPGAKLTYVMLLSYAHQKGSCFPGQVTLARDLGAGERSVRRYLQELESMRLLQVQRRGLGKTNLYVLSKWVPSRAANVAAPDRPKTPVLERPIRQPEKDKSEERPEHHQDVAGELIAFGIERDIALQLARAYEPAYVRDRLARVQYLQETNPRAIRKTPQAFLVAALKHPGIEPAPDYQTPAERAARAQARTAAQARAAAAVAAEAKRAERQRAAEKEERVQAMAAFRRAHPAALVPGTRLSTESAWQRALERLRTSVGTIDYTAWLADTVLVSCDASAGVVAAQNGFAARRLAERFDHHVRAALAAVLGFPVTLRYLAFTDLSCGPERLPIAIPTVRPALAPSGSPAADTP
jgi:hypothetical protein